jgi:cysteine desulfuration protein SufE
MQIEEYKVKGCMSQVWLVPGTTSAGAFAFAADSDAHIVKGLIAVLASLFSGQRPDVVADLDAEAAMRELELDQHLSPSRRNGLVAMVQRIKQFAAARRQD